MSEFEEDTDLENSIPKKYRLSYELTIECIEGRITPTQAAKIMGVHPDTVRARIRNFRRKGISYFFHKRRKSDNRKKTVPDEKADKIAELYRSQYKGFSFSTFTEILGSEHNIFLSRNVLSKILKDRGISSPDEALHLRTWNNTFADLEELILYMKPYIESDASIPKIEELGCIYCCERLFDLSCRALKKTIIQVCNKKCSTSPAILETAHKLGLVKDPAPWNYWYQNHKYFNVAYYDNDVRKKVMHEIRALYYPMLCNVYETIKSSMSIIPRNGTKSHHEEL